MGSDEVDVEGEVEESENEKEDKIEELQLSQEVFNVPILLAEDSPQCNVVEAHVLQLEGGTIAYIHSQPQGNYKVYVYINYVIIIIVSFNILGQSTKLHRFGPGTTKSSPSTLSILVSKCPTTHFASYCESLWLILLLLCLQFSFHISGHFWTTIIPKAPKEILDLFYCRLSKKEDFTSHLALCMYDRLPDETKILY